MPINREIKITMDVEANAQKAQQELIKLSQQFDKLIASTKQQNSLGLSSEIDKSINKARELQQILNSSKNSNGTLDLSKFNQQLARGQTSLKEYSKILNSLGPEGSKAFSQMVGQINAAQAPLRKTNKLVDELRVTLANTAKWQISSTILHGFMSSVQQAINYVENLNESLTNIRIVTGHDTEYMADFAKKANEAAQSLSASTTAYTDAALIYYQQGLDDDEVIKRTNATIQMVHATGDSATEVSSYMTAIWNNFYDGSESVEHFGDVIAALGASTASSSSEIASGLQQFAAIAETTGLSYDYATSSLATLVANTRQSADTVGTALKTIFSRIQGLSLGETLEDGTDLNKYSTALAKIGVSIKDASGELRDMDDILDDTATAWQNLSKDQQMATAQTVAGVRQYTYFMSLMNNWDDMTQNLDTAANADGTLEEQSKIYQEGWEAARDRVTAALQEIYSQLLDDKFFIKITSGFAKFLNIISDTIDTLGGLPGVLSLVWIGMNKAFGPQMADAIRNITYNFKDQQAMALQTKKEANDALRSMVDNNNGSEINQAENAALKVGTVAEADVNQTILNKRQELENNGIRLAEQDELILSISQSIVQEISKQAQEAGALYDKEVLNNDILMNQLRLKGKLNSESTSNTSLMGQNTAALREALNIFTKETDEAEKMGQNIDQASQKARQMASAFKEQGLATAASEMENFAKDLDINSKNPDQAFKNFNSKIEELEGETNQHFDNLRDSAIAAGEDVNIVDQLQNNSVAMGTYAANASAKLANVKDTADKVNQSIGGIKGLPPDVADGIVSLGQTMAKTAMIASSLKGLFETWNNEDMSFGEKLISTMTTLGIIIPVAAGGLKNLNAAMIKQNAAQTLAGISGLSAALGYETMTAAEISATIASEGLAAAIWAVLAPLLPLIAAIAAIVAGIALFIKAVQYVKSGGRLGKELEEASEKASELSEALNEAKEEVESLKSAFDSYDSAVEALENCTRGTQEWRDALQEVNNQVLDLIAEYPELAEYVTTNEDGMMEISEEGQKVLTDRANQKVATAQGASVQANQDKREAQIKVDAQELKNALYNTSLSDTERNELSKKIDATAEGKDGGLSKDDIAKISEAGENGRAVADKANELTGAIQANTSATEAENQAMANNLLADNENVQNSDYKNEIMSAAGRLYDQNYEQAEKDFAYFGLRGQDKSDFNDYAEAAGISGTFVKAKGFGDDKEFTYKDSAGEEQTVRVDEMQAIMAAAQANGNLAESAESLLTAFDNLEKSEDNLAEGTTKTADSLIGFIGSGNFAGSTQGEVDQIRADIKEAGGKNSYLDSKFGDGDGSLSDEEAQAMGYESAGVFEAAFGEALANYDIDTSKMEENWSQALSSAMDNVDLSDASQETKEALANQMNELVRGGMSTDTLGTMFEAAGDDADAFVEVLNNMNWDAATPESFAAALEEAGVQTNYTSDTLGTLISQMSQVSDGLSEIDFESQHSLIDGLSDGATIDEDKYNQLDSSMQQYFQKTLDGNYILIESADTLKNKLLELQDAKMAQDVQTAATQLEATNSYEEKGLGEQAENQDYDKVEAQLQYLEALGDSDEELAENIDKWREMNSEAQATKGSTSEYAQEVAQAAEELYKEKGDAEDLTQAWLDAKEAQTAFNEESFLENLDSDASREDVENLADAYQEVNGKVSDTYDRLTALKDAQKTLRANNAVEDLADNYEDYQKTLKDVQKAQNKADKAIAKSGSTYKAMRETLADLIDVNEDLIDGNDKFLDSIDPDDLEAAADGNEEAIERIQTAWIDSTAEMYGLEDEAANFKDSLAGLADGAEIDIDNTPFITKLAESMLAAGAGASDIQETLSGMGVDIDVTPIKGSLEEAKAAAEEAGNTIVEAGSVNAKANTQNIEQTSTEEDVGFDEEITTKTIESNGDQVAESDGKSTTPIHQQLTEYHKIVKPKTETAEETKNTPVTAVELSNAHKSAGGGISSANKGTRRASGGGGRRGGGSRRSSSRKSHADRVRRRDLDIKTQSEERDRYHEINNTLEKINRKLDRYDNQANRAFGSKRIKAIKETTKAYKELADSLGTKKDEAIGYLASDRLKAMSYGWQFDDDGNVTGYEDTLKDLIEDYNKAQKEYMTTHNDIAKKYTSDSKTYKKLEEEAKDKLEKAKEEFNDAKESLSTYEETKELVESLIDEQKEAIQDAIDANVEAIAATVEIKFDIEDDSIDYLDYLIDRLGDGADTFADAIGYMGQQAKSYMNQATAASVGLSDLLKDFTDTEIYSEKTALTQDDVNKILTGQMSDEEMYSKLSGLKDKYGNAASITEDQIEQFRDLRDKYQETASSLYDLRNEQLEKVIDAFNEYTESIHRNSEEIEHLQSVTETYKNIIDIVGKKTLDASGNLTKQLSRTNWELQRNNTHALKSELDAQKEMLAGYQKALEEAIEQGASEAVIKGIKDQIQEAEDTINSTTEEFNSSWEAEMQSIADIFAENIETIVDTLQDAVAGALGSLDELTEAFDRKSQIDDIYLDDYEKIYELSKLNRDIEKSIDDTDNIKGKKALKALQEELNALQEDGIELSQYDIENTRRRYELELARQKLLEAKNTKSTVRMTRDSEGNYGYVYTADQDKVAEAEQEYEDKLYAMQQANAQYIEELQNNIVSAEQDYLNAIADIDPTQYSSEEELEAAIQSITDDYNAIVSGYSQQLNTVLSNNQSLYENEWAEYSKLTGYKISADENYIDNFQETTYATLTGFDTMGDAQNTWVTTSTSAVQQVMDAYNEWYQDMQIALSDGETSIEDFGATTEAVIEELSEAGAKAEESAASMAEEYTQSFDTILTAMQTFVSNFDSEIEKIITAANTATDSINEMITAAANINAVQTVKDIEKSKKSDPNIDDEQSVYEDKLNETMISDAITDVQKQKDRIERNQNTYRQTLSLYNAIKNSRKTDRQLKSKYRGRYSDTVISAALKWKRNKRDYNRAYETYKRRNRNRRNLMGRTEYIMTKKLGLSNTSVRAGLNRFIKDQNYTQAIKDAIAKVVKFDTGGYTGNWSGSNGRMALLHQKELVLNASDTENILNAVNAIRDISKQIDLNALSTSTGFSSLLKTPYISDGSQTLEQQVSITAEFPNVTDRNEIESAFDNLINKASQFANRK